MQYRKANRRKCYWLCPDCLKGYGQCSLKCPGYLSVAKADILLRERRENFVYKMVSSQG